jgi:hypothetical protein
VAAAAAVVLRANLSSAETYVSLVSFCLLATWSILVMEVYAAFRPERSHALLNRLRRWINIHMDQSANRLNETPGI